MFSDRTDAAKKLSEKIACQSDSVVLAIPRGGVILGDIIAQNAGCILDVVISKKITPPQHSEYAIGAITHDGTLYKSKYWSMFSTHPDFKRELREKQKEVKRRLEQYRSNDHYELDGKHVILVDDGIATGSTVFAILNWIKKQNPKKITLAIPVIPFDTFQKINDSVDELVALDVPEEFMSVSQYYEDFSQISDSHVNEILNEYH